MKAVGYTKPLPIRDAESLLDIEVPTPKAIGRDVLVEVKENQTAFFTIGPIARPGGFHPGFLGLVANSAVMLLALASKGRA